MAVSVVPNIFGHMDLHLSDPFRPVLGLHVEDPFLDMRRATHSYDTELRRLRYQIGAAEVKSDKDSFQVTLDATHFKPEEVEVKLVGNDVTIQARHEERRDGHGYVSREFTRRYHLPEECDVERVSSSISSNGVLHVTAPKKPIEGPKGLERIIPIQVSSVPINRAVLGGEENAEKQKK